MNTVYLAGPINGRTDDDCKGWRAIARRILGTACRVLDPMDRDYRGNTEGNEAAIVERDKQDIDESDSVIVWFDRPSVGTSMEILYAWERGKPVYVVSTSAGTLSPWIHYHSRVVPALEIACRMAVYGRD